jgi:hypothetical protein
VRRQGIDWRTVVTTQSTAESGRMETLVLARPHAHTPAWTAGRRAVEDDGRVCLLRE